MSDTTNETVEETVEETPAVEQEASTDAKPTSETVEDVGPLKRAYERVKEELSRYKDENARSEILREWGFELTDSDEADTSEEDLEFEEDERQPEVRDPRVDELLAERDQNRIRTDLDRFNAESGWDLDDDDRRAIEIRGRLQGGEKFGPEHLEAAHKWFIDRLERAANAGVERAKKPKPKPSHVTKSGQAATEVPDLEDRNERRRWIAEELQRRSTAT